MLRDARRDVAGDPRIKSAVSAPHDVDEPDVSQDGTTIGGLAARVNVMEYAPNVRARAAACSLVTCMWLLSCGSEDALSSRASRAPPRVVEPDTSWIGSNKLDGDLKELVLRAWDADLAFPFRVRMRPSDGGVAESTVRVRPREIEELVRDGRVLSVRCAPPAAAPAHGEAWRTKVDPDVRTVVGAQSACWAAVTLRFEREPTDDEWQSVEDTGVVIHARDARTALVWAPVRAIPPIASLSFIGKIERFERDVE